MRYIVITTLPKFMYYTDPYTMKVLHPDISFSHGREAFIYALLGFLATLRTFVYFLDCYTTRCCFKYYFCCCCFVFVGTRRSYICCSGHSITEFHVFLSFHYNENATSVMFVVVILVYVTSGMRSAHTCVIVMRYYNISYTFEIIIQATRLLHH